MGTGQVSKKLGRSRQGVINLAVDKKLRAVHVGGAYADGKGVWIYDPDSVEDFANKQERKD